MVSTNQITVRNLDRNLRSITRVDKKRSASAVNLPIVGLPQAYNTVHTKAMGKRRNTAKTGDKALYKGREDLGGSGSKRNSTDDDDNMYDAVDRFHNERDEEFIRLGDDDRDSDSDDEDLAGNKEAVLEILGRFSEDLAAAYFCATDAKTPMKVKGTLLAALAYFILPADMVPDFFAVVGFSDDLAVFTAAMTLVQAHVTDEHREKAKAALAVEEEPAA